MLTAYLVIWAIMSIITGLVYGCDKMQAKNGGWRVRETALLLLALCLGAPGAMTAMYTLRHKTLKPLFVVAVPSFLILQALFAIALIA